MTVSTDTNKAGPYEGNGSTTAFPFTFKVFAAADVVATFTSTAGVESTLVQDGDYSVTINADQDDNPGGTITYPISGTALAADEYITIARSIAATQTVELPNGGGWYPRTVERMFDKLTILVQQALEVLTRCVRFPISDPAVGSEFPTVAQRAGKMLGFNDEGSMVALASLPESSVTITAFGEQLVEAADAAEAHDVLELDYQGTCGGRLSYDATYAVPTADVTAATSVYLHALTSDRIGLYDGTRWVNKRFNPSVLTSGARVAIPSTTDTNFDVFAYLDAGVVKLETLSWTNDTTRATGLVRVNSTLGTGGGCFVKNGDSTRRYLGTGRTTGVSGQSEDSAKKRFLWNYYNQLPRRVKAMEATASWNYSTDAYRVVNGGTEYIQAVCGARSSNEVLSTIDVTAKAYAINSDATLNQVSLAVHHDNTIGTPAAADGLAAESWYTSNDFQRAFAARYVGFMKIGLNYIAPIEKSSAGGVGDTTTWYGSSQYSGIYGTINM